MTIFGANNPCGETAVDNLYTVSAKRLTISSFRDARLSSKLGSKSDLLTVMCILPGAGCVRYIFALVR